MCTVPLTIVKEEEAEELDSAGEGEWEQELVKICEEANVAGGGDCLKGWSLLELGVGGILLVGNLLLT